MKTIEKRKRNTFLSIFAVCVFLFSGTSVSGQNNPDFTDPCPQVTMVTLPPGGGPIILDDSTIADTLNTSAIDPDGVSAITYTSSVASIGCGDIGVVPIIITATDVDGSTDCIVNVTVLDGGPLAVCQDITVSLDAAGMVTVTPADIDGGSSTCNVFTDMTIDGSSVGQDYTCADIGTFAVTLEVTDATGTSSCMAMVTVQDDTDPTFDCPLDADLALDANCQVTIPDLTGGLNEMDNCGAPTVVQSPVAGTLVTLADGGTTSVMITVTDGSMNDASCSVTFTGQDMTAPNAVCQNITVSLDAMGNYTLTAAEINNGSDDNCGTANISIPATTFTCADLGDNMVTLTVDDGNGNSDMCTATVTVEDNTPPDTYPDLGPINNATNNCEATVTWPSTLNDACVGAVVPTNVTAVDFKGNNVPVLVSGPNFFGDFPVGVSTVTYDVSDGSNSLTGQTFTITVVDTEAPTLTCPADQTQDITSCAPMQMVPSFIGLATFADNCATSLTITQTPAPNTDLTTVAGVSNPPADGDTYTVMIEVSDGFNTTMCGPFTVTLSEDDAPQPDAPGATLPMLTSTCGPLVVTAPTATDACGDPVCGEPFPVDPSVWTQVPGTGPCPGSSMPISEAAVGLPTPIIDGSCLTPGDETVSTINITESGTIGTDATLESVEVNISHTWNTDLDITLISPAGTSLDLSSDNGGTGDDYDAIFQDGGMDVTAATSPIMGVFQAEGGTFASTFAGESITGNWTLSVCDDEFILDGTLNAWSINFSTTPSGSIPQYEFQPGNHVITWIYDDGNGNTSSQLQQINVSNDMVDPVVTCQDITLELDAAGNASLVADDLVAASGFTMEMTEDFGNNANNPGRVSMSVTAPSNINFSFDWDYENNDPGFEGLFYLVNGLGNTVNGTLISDVSDNGTTTVPLLAGDVLTIQIFTPDNVFGESSEVTITNITPGFTEDYSIGNWDFSELGVINTSLSILDGDPSDDCTDVMTLIPTLSASQTTFDCSDINNPTSVTLSVTDEAGNVGTCTAMVTVIDALEPFLTVSSGNISDMTVDCENIPPANQVVIANDNCDGSLTVTLNETSTQSNNSASCAFYNYDITRTWSATDASSNTGDTVQVITVEDNDDPVIDAMDITRNFTAGGTLSTDATGCTASISLSILGAIEDCAADADLTITNDSPFADANGGDASGDYPLGTHVIQFTITDPCGNSSNWSESFTVEDNVAPVASCVNDLNLGLPASGVLILTPTAVDNNSFDNCSADADLTLSVAPSMFDCSHVGIPQDVTLTVTDENGNSSTCTTTVNIQDNNAPTALCTSTEVFLDENGMASITGADVDNSSFDDCTAVTLAVSPSTFTEADLGNNTVTLTVTDMNGNSTSCSANVLVSLPPTCFNIGVASGGAGEVISIPVTSEDFTSLVGFQFELQLNNEDAGEFVGISNINPALTNVLQENLIVTDSFISQIDSMVVTGSMGQDSTVYDSIYTDNNDRMSISWNQFNTDGMGDLVAVTFPDGEELFSLDIQLTGNIGDFTIVSVNTGSGTTPPQVVYSFGSGFIPAPACINQGAITIGQLIISGDIFNEDGAAVNLVDVDLLQPPSSIPVQSDQTMTDGAYSFTISAQGTFVIEPSKNINWSNGIDILDVSLIQRHSVGNPYVNSAYKKIAADVSGEGAITTFDAVLLNSYLASLFMDPPPPTASWQFVDAKDVIANDPNAFVPPFASTITLTNIMSDSTGNDFIAVKTGDLGGLVNADTLQFGEDAEGRTGNLEFIIEDRALKTGESVSIDLYADNFKEMVAYQWILEFDNEVLSYTGFDNVNLENLGDIGFGEVIINEGKLVLTWYAGTEVTKSVEDLLYSLNFEVKADARLSDLLKVTSHERMSPVAYNANETAMDIDLIFTQPEAQPSVFTLNQNTPNPFKDETVISFVLPEATSANITIMDITGRVLKFYEGDFAQGYNEISVNRSELPQSGTLIYELKTPDNTASMKMIVID